MRIYLLLLLVHILTSSFGQPVVFNSCIIPYNQSGDKAIDQLWASFKRSSSTFRTNEEVITLPVVFHMIHQSGGGNISDAAAIEALNNLNSGFANNSRYDQGSGVDTKIRFCLAKVDPDGNFTSGINHVYADLPKVIPQIHDGFLKSLINWDPRRYINIWVVKDIQLLIEATECEDEDSEASGYATMPSAHGSSTDGIVIEANSLTSSVIIHEMGHYLGLLHTFDGGCANNDCNSNGDQVCDTPPQIKKAAKCDGSSNSCSSDIQSGFTSDQPDLPFNFMDYGSCPHDFTLGQKERMRFMVFTIRNSLLGQNTCESRCPYPSRANYTFPVIDYKIGDFVLFTNQSTGNFYEWKVNEQLVATTTDLSYQFLHQGWFKIDLLSKSAAGSQCNNRQVNWLKVFCAVKPRIAVSKIKVKIKEDVQFSSTATIIRSGTEPVLYKWYFNDTLFSTAASPIYQFETSGEKIIYLVTQKGNCLDTSNYELVTVKPLPDFKLKLNLVKCEGENGRKLLFTVCNEGFDDVPAGLPVTFYYNNPTRSLSQPVTSVFYTDKAIGKFCCEEFEVNLPGFFESGREMIFGVINDNGSLATPFSFSQFPITNFPERDYTNNLDSLKLELFSFKITPKDTMVLLGSSITFNSSANLDYRIKWSSSKGFFSCDTCKMTQYVADAYAQVIATAISESGCQARDTAIVKIFIDQEILVPSAFTPNKDNKNDVFYILGSRHVSKINTFRIYNRWGEKVFERHNFSPNLPEFGWDGTHKGKEAPTAVYACYFTVDFMDKSRKTYKGIVTLIR